MIVVGYSRPPAAPASSPSVVRAAVDFHPRKSTSATLDIRREFSPGVR